MHFIFEEARIRRGYTAPDPEVTDMLHASEVATCLGSRGCWCTG